jgi:hypothetical protein
MFAENITRNENLCANSMTKIQGSIPEKDKGSFYCARLMWGLTLYNKRKGGAA